MIIEDKDMFIDSVKECYPTLKNIDFDFLYSNYPSLSLLIAIAVEKPLTNIKEDIIDTIKYAVEQKNWPWDKDIFN